MTGLTFAPGAKLPTFAPGEEIARPPTPRQSHGHAKATAAARQHHARHAAASVRGRRARVPGRIDHTEQLAQGGCGPAERPEARIAPRQDLHHACVDRGVEGGMSRPTKGARLWRRPEKRNPDGSLRERAVWVI